MSSLLRDYRINPYIWRRAKLRTLIRDLSRKYGTVGVLGVACIVELVAGMRRCLEAGIPAVGIPLNVNRCPRWTNGFYETSVDLNALQQLLSNRG